MSLTRMKVTCAVLGAGCAPAKRMPLIGTSSRPVATRRVISMAGAVAADAVSVPAGWALIAGGSSRGALRKKVTPYLGISSPGIRLVPINLSACNDGIEHVIASERLLQRARDLGPAREIIYRWRLDDKLRPRRQDLAELGVRRGVRSFDRGDDVRLGQDRRMRRQPRRPVGAETPVPEMGRQHIGEATGTAD